MHNTIATMLRRVYGEHTMKTRIQVSIHPQLVAVAEKLMVDEMFNSFSAYMEKLIREEDMRRRATGDVVNSPAVEVKRLLRSTPGTTTATKARKVQRG